MATENDASHDKKLVIGIAAVVILAVGGLGYVGWSWLNAPVQTPSHIDVTNVANSSHRNSAETPEYRKLLGEYNTNGAEQARQDNSSFIASIPVGDSTPVTEPPPPPKVKKQPAHHQSARQSKQQQNNGLSEDEKKSLAQIMQRINGDDAPPGTPEAATLAVAMEPGVTNGGNGSRGQTASPYAEWTDSIMPQQASLARDAEGNAAAHPIELIPAFTRTAAQMDFGVDSDNSVTPAVVRINTGPYAGAVLKAPRAQLAGDGVVLHLNNMYWKGKNYTVDAYALKDDTLMANVATDVNHHYVSRILVPAIASGIGKAGDLYSDANTDILTNGYSTVTSHAGMPNGEAVAGVIAGGTASEAANVLRSDAAKLPSTTVTVDAGQAVFVEFMAPVTTADEIKPRGNGGSVVQPTSSREQSTSSDTDISPASPSLTQLRAQTRERIQSQLKSQNSATSPE